MKKLILVALHLIFALFFVFPLLNAQGCCFNPTNGACSSDSEENSCTSIGGTYYGDSCSFVDSCAMGCCSLGTSTRFETRRTCDILSEQHGIELNWQTIDEASCELQGKAQEEGACLLGEFKDKCQITTREKCVSADFTPNVNCVQMGKTNMTNNTMCYKESVYFKDSAGNPASINQTCSYDNGTICRTDKTKSNQAYCADLNCVDKDGKKRKNGESWCRYENVIYSASTVPEIVTQYDEITGTDGIPYFTGSRFFREYCQDGQVVTEGCADRREEVCLTGVADEKGNVGAECEINKADDCALANSADKTSGKTTVDEEACDGDYCFVWSPRDCVKNADTGVSLCGSQRNSYQSLGWTSADETESNMMKELNLNLCVPDISTGQHFWSSIGASTSSTGVCSAGNFKADVKFFQYHYCVPIIFHMGNLCMADEWGLQVLTEDQSAEDTGINLWGNAALLGDSEDKWTKIGGKGEREGTNGNTYCQQENIQNGWFMQSVCRNKGALNFYNAVSSVLAGALFYGLAAPVIYYSQDDVINNIDEGCDIVDDGGVCPFIDEGESSIPANSRLIDQLGVRCRALGDCDGKANFLGTAGTDVGGADDNLACTKSGDTVTCSFEYTCSAYKAPAGDSDCSKCGADGLDCTEYRCMALGKGCAFKEPEGASKGYCVASSDHSPPIISLKNMTPSSPIQPFTPVEITIATNEASECRFNINNAGAKYENMKWEFGTEGFDLEHTVKLNVPGQIPGLKGNISEYPLIVPDGNYTVYIRCTDVAGNWNLAAYTVHFEVMRAPDKIILPPRNFVPPYGSLIKFNTTTKLVKFDMQETAECRWDFDDKDFDNMTYNFSCTTDINSDPREGYSCSGTLTNITPSNQTKYESRTICVDTSSGQSCSEQLVPVADALKGYTQFYIRCKDQPQMENESIMINGVNYSRNKLMQSTLYILGNSGPLIIQDAAPSGNMKKGAGNITLQLSLVTKGGSEDGKAKCYWSHSNESLSLNISYILLLHTNAGIHTQPVTSPFLGANYIALRCVDSAGNYAYENLTFNLELDMQPPTANRVYGLNADVRIRTDEEANCYFSLDSLAKCDFKIENATKMQSLNSLTHYTGKINDKTYFIKCQDFAGNHPTGDCTIIVDTRGAYRF